MKKLLIHLIFTLPLLAQAQLEDDLDYYREITWGINKNTNSALIGGFIFKVGLQQEEGIFHTYGLEILNVTHPKEQKYFGQVSGSNYVWGKSNHLYSFRFQYGREKVLFKKAPQKGVQISTVFAGGPTWALVSPYYVLGADQNYAKFTVQDFPSRSAVGGSGKIFQGLGESKHKIGLNAKSGLSFEFGNFKSSVVGLETGVAIEAFTQKIPIMAVEDNKAVFTSIYFSLYWGRRR
ncbi:hypothetical protein [Marinoscillum sp. MHG1-6]|uniref:hypothetical protein n=1 Tax=Marinoscillum sp. MHG1-6 TaxID=2959627 RepID=UPI0021573D63|nr:hypothetical protein [Marinoscillum sp. MHG1-6]